jgi:predicted DNA binding CopG/RHH family protein
MKRKAKSLAKLPRLRSDGQAEQFAAGTDLTRFDLSTMKPMQFEFAPREARINMRLREPRVELSSDSSEPLCTRPSGRAPYATPRVLVWGQ